MTVQELDSCEFEGETWYLIAWRPRAGNGSPAPSNDELGLAVNVSRTSNFRGRTDRFAVREGRLFLERVAASLGKYDRLRCDAALLPPGAVRKEDVPLLGDVAFFFDGCALPFTGELEIGTDADHAILRDTYAHFFRRRAVLTFDEGRLIASRFETEESPESPPNVV